MCGIDKIIYDAEDIDLTGDDIFRITDGKCEIMKYEDLKNYDDIDSVLGHYGAVVILYQTKENFGHWVCLFKKNDTTLEFFDPYGLSVDEELEISPKFNMRLHNGVLTPHLSSLINKSGYRLITNKTQIQKFLKHTETCGRHVSLRIRLRNIELGKYIRLLTKNEHYDADFWVSALTILV